MLIYVVQRIDGKILYTTFDQKDAEQFAEKRRKASELVNVQELSAHGSFKVPTPKGDIMVSETDPSYPGVNIDLLPKGGKPNDRIGIATIESNTEEDGKITCWWFGDPDVDEPTNKLQLSMEGSK